MNYSADPYVRSLIERLVSHLCSSDDTDGKVRVSPPADAVETALRTLRPSTSSQDHTVALKARIRQQILNHPTTVKSNNGTVIVSQFEKDADNLRRVNPSMPKQVFALLKPLMFHEPKPKKLFQDSFRARTANDLPVTGGGNTANSKNLFANKNLFDDAADRDINNGGVGERVVDGISNDEMVATMFWLDRETERVLLHDLIYIFQGIGGKHIRFDPRTETYIIDPALQLNATIKDTISYLCELGFLFGKVNTYLKKVFSNTGRTSSGLMIQAFGFALQEELQDYYRLLAVIEQELTNTPTLVKVKGLVEGGGSTNNSSKRENTPISPFMQPDTTKADNRQELCEYASSSLTLLRLKAWMNEPIDRMFLLARLVDGAGPLSGGALASRLHNHARHGDPYIRNLVQRVMRAVCSPLYGMLNRWLTHGELKDAHNEFFVASNLSAASSARNLWRETYYLRRGMLPSFFSDSLAKQILGIGKSINFIKLCLQKLPKSEITGGSKIRRSNRQANKAMKAGMYGIVSDTDRNYEDASGEATRSRTTTPTKTKRAITATAISSNRLAEPQITTPGNDENLAENAAPLGSPSMTAITSNAQATALSTIVGVDLEDLDDPDSAAWQYGEDGQIALESLVSRLCRSTDTRLLDLIMNRFHLQMHFSALKKFLLLGQGDFVTHLMDSVGPELRKRANQLYRHNLTGILEGALRASNAQYENPDVLDRIGIRLLDASPGDSGWEVFSLDYTVEAPLNAVVHGECLAKYRVAFHMLWRLKRVEWNLNASWKELSSFQHTCGDWRRVKELGGDEDDIAAAKALRSVFHRCALNRARMTHVVNNFCAFLMFEVMEGAWIQLQERISRALSLDDVIDAHDTYLNEILDRALLSPQHEVLNMQIQQLLQTILRFCNLEETLVADALAAMARRRVARGAAEERSKKGEWGSTSASYSSPGGGAFEGGRSSGSGIGAEDTGVPEYVIQRLDEAVLEYNKQFDTMMLLLKDQGDQAGDMLRFLTFRLDFNEYHSKQESQEDMQREQYTDHDRGGFNRSAGSTDVSPAAASTAGTGYRDHVPTSPPARVNLDKTVMPPPARPTSSRPPSSLASSTSASGSSSTAARRSSSNKPTANYF